jgi:hypothetical protein
MTDLSPAGSLWEAMHAAQERELADNPHAELAEVYGAMISAVAGWMRTHQDPAAHAWAMRLEQESYR